MRTKRPDVIFLDLNLPDMTGFEILDRLKSHVDTQAIPVIINTSKVLDESERERLAKKTVAILAKGSCSRADALSQVRLSLKMAGILGAVVASAESPDGTKT